MKTEHRSLVAPRFGDWVERLSHELFVSLFRDYFAEDDGEMVPRTPQAVGKEAMGLVLLNSGLPAGHKPPESPTFKFSMAVSSVFLLIFKHAPVACNSSPGQHMQWSLYVNSLDL